MYSALLVIDLQKEFKDNGCKNYNKVIKFVNENMRKYDFLIGTCFKNGENKLFKEMLDWNGCENSSIKDSIEYNYNDHPNHLINLKFGYGIDQGLIDYIKVHNIDTVYIIGCNSDSCVLATCYRLFDEQINFKVMKDYIYTTSKIDNLNDTVIKIIDRNFFNVI